MSPVAEPTLRTESRLYKEGARYVIGVDEVGRGAIAGPVAVGVCVIDATVGRMPQGLRDSKLLSEKRREELAPLAAQWVRCSAVGLATAQEVDDVGIIAALGLAGVRALVAVEQAGAEFGEAVLLLDGSHNWLAPAGLSAIEVRTRVKADRDCASVAAASVIAKVHRDRIMIDAHPDAPQYNWRSNKGYASTEHYDAIRAHGPSELHRLSWLHKGHPLEGVDVA
ncbi:ribonuclease HII [soil metagenome]